MGPGDGCYGIQAHLFSILMPRISRIRAFRYQIDASFIVCHDATSRQGRKFQKDAIT